MVYIYIMENNQNTIKPGMTLDMKAKLFAQYWGQNIYREHDRPKVNDYVDMLEEINEQSYLELTLLSDISNEDATEIAKIECPDLYHKQYPNYGRFLLDNLNNSLTKQKVEIVDYLRSKGYALPWMGYSVEDMVQAGWIKLKGGK